MIDKLYNKKFWLGKNVMGLTITLSPSGVSSGKAVHIKRKKSETNIDDQWSFNSIDIPKKVKRTYPCVVNLSGSGIIHKIAKKGDKVNDHFPDFNSSQFYVQTIPFSSGYVISVIRKSKVDDIIEELRGMGFTIAGISLGAPLLINYAAIIDSNVETIAFDGLQFVIEQGKVTGVSRSKDSDHSLYISGGRIDTATVPAYLSALNYFVKGAECSAVDWTDTNREVFFKRMIKITGLSVLILFFTILMVNYLLFDYYSSLRAEQDNRFSFNQSTLREHSLLKKKLEYKRTLFERFYSVRDRDFAYYADRVFADTPAGVSLTEWWMSAPEIKRNRFKKSVEYNYGTIKVSGTARTDVAFERYVNRLKNNKLVERVYILDFVQPGDSKPGEFKLNVVINKGEDIDNGKKRKK